MFGFITRWRWRNLAPPTCVGCRHSQADHYPGCINVGPAPEFRHCECRYFRLT